MELMLCRTVSRAQTYQTQYSLITGSQHIEMKISQVINTPLLHTLSLTFTILDGLFITYPMKAPTREREKNKTLIETEGKNYKHFMEVSRTDPN